MQRLYLNISYSLAVRQPEHSLQTQTGRRLSGSDPKIENLRSRPTRLGRPNVNVYGDSGAETAIPESSTRSCFCEFDTRQSLATRRLRCFPRAGACATAAGILRRRTAAVANANAITITMEVDDITPAQPATAARGRLPPSKTRGVGRGLSWSNEELTERIVQGYSISSDSAEGAGRAVEKNAGRMRAAFIEPVRRTRAPLTLIKFTVAVWCCSRASAVPRRSVGRCIRLCQRGRVSET
jgi:hypothetical protein